MHCTIGKLRMVPTGSSTKLLTLAIIDDDPAVLDALRTVFELAGGTVQTYASGARFLASAKQPAPDCVLLDAAMPGPSGLEVLAALGGGAYPAPIIMMSGLGDIPRAVAAIKAGAHDFVEKPFDVAIVERVGKAVQAFRARKLEKPASRAKPGTNAHLTEREQEVLISVTRGLSNKEVARVLSISPRTVEVHRARIMEKLGARNTADLMRIVLAPGLSGLND